MIKIVSMTSTQQMRLAPIAKIGDVFESPAELCAILEIEPRLVNYRNMGPVYNLRANGISIEIVD